ncbi:acyl carrier protein [Lentzea kentuckyensis]|uniref:acyl carrier protein n=1 Tax=Lentzea kentuckyensis TaxID=360086 RepID=UPI000A3B2565|nr:acyl carrier protein [Lentzea kentuckyensis]
MKTVEEFIDLVRDQLGLPLTADDADTTLSALPGWDSVHLLRLLTVLEKRTGRDISLPELLEASTLDGIYRMAVAS